MLERQALRLKPSCVWKLELLLSEQEIVSYLKR